jgi:L-fuconolactonase
MSGRVIDSHEHAWTFPNEYDWKSENTPPGVSMMVYTVEDVLADMEEHGINQTTLVATPIHGRGSPYTRECLREYPERFYGIILLDYFADDVEDRVHDALEQENLLGVRLGAFLEYDSLWEEPNEEANWITNDGLADFWEALETHDSPQVQILLHPEQFDQAEEVIADHPEIMFVLDHLGWPTPGDHRARGDRYTKLADISEHSNAHVKMSHTPSIDPYPFHDIHEYVRYLVEQFGTDRLVWGSDYVYHFKETTYWESLHFLDELSFLSETDRRRLRHRTFESLLP